ncbi:MAG: hypothetical protein E4G99_10570 [Anaerolineales bacterium]|nr:MAG: hypothetical protein E4G99_10570 [Anaerolineales bacterium]
MAALLERRLLIDGRIPSLLHERGQAFSHPSSEDSPLGLMPVLCFTHSYFLKLASMGKVP